MKKRILSIVLTLCMVLALMPQMTAEAASWENEIWIGNTPVNQSTNMTDNTWVFFPGYNTLVLSDGFVKTTASNLSGSKDKAVIRVGSIDNLTIQLLGNATVGVPSTEYLPPEAADGISTYGIYAPNTSLAIEGTGTLNVNSNANAIWCKDLRVESPTLNCNSFRTAIRVIDSSASIDTAATRGNMLVKSGATVTAKTTSGSGIYPETFVLGGYGADYRDNGGAAILVSGSLTVENSTVNAENSCNKLPTVTSDFTGFNGILDKTNVFYRSSFCTTIFVWNDLTVSGSDASVTGKLKNTTSGYIDDSGRYSFRLGAVVANKMYVKEGGTLEGFITTTYHSEYAQGLRRFYRESHDLLVLENALISRSGEGTVRSGIVNIDVAVETPEYADGPYYVTEDFSPTQKYGNHLEITIGKVSTVYLRTTDSGPEWSFQSNFGRAYSLDGATIDFRDFHNSVFVQNGWPLDWGIPNIYIQSGNWTIIPPSAEEVNYYIESGTQTIQLQDQRKYAGGHIYIAENATVNIQGDGIGENWEISPINSTATAGGAVRFISGTVKNAQADMANKVYILDGNINFNLKDYSQVVRREDGLQLYKDIYVLSPCTDRLTTIQTGEQIITPEESYYYPLGDDLNLVVWTVNDLPIKYVTVTQEDGETYNLIPGGSIEGLGSEYHRLVRAERYREFVPNPNYKFFRNPDESVTMNAAGSINTYENRLDSAFYGPYLIGSTTDLDSSLRAEWSYQKDNGEKVVVGGNSLTCTINDLSDIVNYRTYTCTVYEKAADGSEKAIGSYNAKVYVMRWEQPDTVYAAIDEEVTFTVNPSAETEWAAGFLSTLKWQVNKGTGWEDIPKSNTVSYTVTITEENAFYKYRRVVWGSTIGNFDKHEAGIYVEMNSPELSVTFAPEIASQPQSIKIQENDTAKHALSVRANNAESYQWQKKVDGAFVDIEGATSSTLEVGVGDVGTYRCVVSNASGETVSEEASVTTNPAPSCGTLSPVKAAFGEKAQFGIGIDNAPGDSGISVKWQYSADDGATWVDVVSTDDRDNISMMVIELVFSQKWDDGTVVIISREIISSSMTINKTTADMDGWKVRCVLTDAVGVYYSNTVELSIEMPDYSVTFDTDGGTEIASKTPVKWEDKVLDGVSDPTKDGWRFTGWKYGDVPVTSQTTYKELVPDGTLLSIELQAQWEDIAAPTGEITIDENSWKAFLNKITFGLFFKDTQTVTITASDNSGEDVTIEYLLSDKELTVDQLNSATFTAYTKAFSINPDNQYVIYAKLTDTSGNVAYINSEGIVLDATAPVITGVENGKTYCEAQTVTVTEEYIESVKVNGTAVTLDANNQFILNPAEGTQTIVATDNAGNKKEMTVTVNNGHTYGTWQSNGAGTHTRYCTVDGCNGYEDGDCDGGEASYFKKAVCDTCHAEYGALLTDSTAPTGEITVGTNKWNSFLNTITFGLFFKDTQSVAITAADDSYDHDGYTDDKAVKVEYYLYSGDTALTQADLAGKEFTEYNGDFNINPDNKYVVYARLTDHAGNVTYISSEGVLLDASVPVISGIENGKTYCEAQTVTVTEEYIESVKVNGTAVTLDANNQFTLNPAEGTQTIVATNKAGNVSAEMIVTVNDGHTYEWQDDNGQYWQKCKYCGDETAKKDIPTFTIDAPDTVCRTQDYNFSFTLPEGTTDAESGYEFTNNGGGIKLTAENGMYSGVLESQFYDENEISFKLKAYAKTTDGFVFSAEKTVAIQNEHSGGVASCVELAICDTCGEPYGELDSTNHNLEKISATDATVTETGNTEYWHCLDCDKYFADENATNEIKLDDTVISKLSPEIIEGKGQSITAGDKKELTFKSNAAFGDFIRVELDGKTLDEKNYTVKEGSTVVTLKADYIAALSAGEHTIGIVSESGTATAKFTVSEKTAEDDDTNPPTGDNSHMALWIALLFVSGCLLTVTVIKAFETDRKRRNKHE